VSTPANESAGLRRFARLVFTASSPGWVCSVPNGLELEPGAFYLVATADGRRVGRMSAFELPVLRTWNGPMPSIVRRASEEETARAATLAVRQRETLDACRRLASEMNLPLRPVSAFAPLDREVVIVTYAAEQRVDFRDLLRELTPRTHCRVELRQVGVRDQAKAAGGWGPCGRLLCCTTFMSRFNSVTIRMAKAQRLSLNPARISGMCGRLMCCLAHEAPPKGEIPAKSDGAVGNHAPVAGEAAAGVGNPAEREAPREGGTPRWSESPVGGDGHGRRDGSGRGARPGRNDRPDAGPKVGRGTGAGRCENSGRGGNGGAASGSGRPDGAVDTSGAGRTGNGDQSQTRGSGAGRTGNGDQSQTRGSGAGRTGNGDPAPGRHRGARSSRGDRSGLEARARQGAGPRRDDGPAKSGEAETGGGPVGDPRPAPDRDPSAST